MRIVMVGTGYVGLVSGACFSEFGVEVVCVDKDTRKIEGLNRGRIPIYEPGLDTLVEKNVRADRLSFTDDIKVALDGADAAFIAVGTPSRRGDGHADLTFVDAAAQEIAAAMNGRMVIVSKSTVPVGTASRLEGIIAAARPGAEPGRDFDVASNPEFLREGSAIEDFMRPDRVVCGVASEHARATLSALYRPLFLRETPIIFTSRETAELTKYAANAFLATKITFINEMADLCEMVGANVQDVARGMGLDGRIGNKFLNAGPGYGGSCFPKDTLALVRTAQEFQAPSRIVEAVVAVNEERKRRMAEKIIESCGGSVDGQRIGVLGVTFKPNTDDMRDAPSLSILPILSDAGASIVAYDPAGMNEAQSIIENVDWANDTYAVAEGADALVILTEWNEFRALDLARLKRLMRRPLLIDLRNIYTARELDAAEFAYVSIGRSPVGLERLD